MLMNEWMKEIEWINEWMNEWIKYLTLVILRVFLNIFSEGEVVATPLRIIKTEGHVT